MTVTTPANPEMAGIIAGFDPLAMAVSWVKLFGRFRGVEENGMTLKKFKDTFPEFAKRHYRVTNNDSVKHLLTEYSTAEDVPTFLTEANEFVYHLLCTLCDGNAYDIVATYGIVDTNSTTACSHDGRRAWLALLRALAPVSQGHTERAMEKLKAFTFTTVPASTRSW